MAILPDTPDWVAPGVSIGDDGNSVNPDPDDGPLLLWFKEFAQTNQAAYEDALANHRKQLIQQMRLSRPSFVPLSGSVQLSTAGTGIIFIDGPQQGRDWVVRSVAISDAGNWTVSTSSATAIVAVGQRNASNYIAPQQVRAYFSTLPTVQVYGSGQFPVNPSDNLFIQINNGSTAGTQNIQATVWVEDATLLSQITTVTF